ncbi:hypothetical protein [Arthrobacter sp. SO3]|uniref:hypothetical protein n=1 Tax=Arthrobacter sp. SO3 TaxID=1897057 RepID=UPI001CFF72E5|nr:hypothetical protein [Arthrobacter sp. SO3]MCB5294331.1 hypothetical protein [Arthrobacter sp. SO3]
MKINKRTLFLIVGGLVMLIGFIQFRTPHYRRDEGGMMMLLVAGFVIALFGHPRGPMGFLRDRFDGWGKSLPDQIRGVEFHGRTSVDRRGIIDTATKAAIRVSEGGSTIRVEDMQVDAVHLSIRGIGGLVTQMSFTISWTTGASGSFDVEITVGQFLTSRPTIYWVIPVGRKRIIALPAMRRFHDDFVRQLNALQAAPATSTMTQSSEELGRSPEPAAGTRSDYSSSVPPLPDHAPAALATSREASAFVSTNASPEAFLPADEKDSHLWQSHAEKRAVSDAAGKGGESDEAALSSQKVDAYFNSKGGQKPNPAPAPTPSLSHSRMSRKARALTAAGTTVALVVLGIVLGAGSWRSVAPNQQGQLATIPTPQPAAIPEQQMPIQTVTPSAVAALPPTPPPQPVSPIPAAQPGDLGLASPLRPVTCTGKFAVFYHSSIVPAAYAQDVQANLVSHPGSTYLLTLGSCSSLYQMSNAGTMIYAVYGGPFDTLAEACVAASRFPNEAYVKVLDNLTPPDQSVRPCA